MNKKLHLNNKHNKGYDFKLLEKNCSEITPFLIKKHNQITIDFSNPRAVKALNKSLLFTYYGIQKWNFSDDNLCPPIPGRVDYIHYLNDLPISLGLKKQEVTVLDIGTGATCIYPLLGNAVFGWHFIGTDIDLGSLESAQNIINDNNLGSKIKLRHQLDKDNILIGAIEKEDVFTFSMCNPPFYKSEKEARLANQRKTQNLKIKATRNFAGNSNELYYKGGEKAFLHNYLYQSTLFKNQCRWFTSLVSKKENVLSLEQSSKKVGVKEFKIIPMKQGNKVTRIAAWRY